MHHQTLPHPQREKNEILFRQVRQIPLSEAAKTRPKISNQVRHEYDRKLKLYCQTRYQKIHNP